MPVLNKSIRTIKRATFLLSWCNVNHLSVPHSFFFWSSPTQFFNSGSRLAAKKKIKKKIYQVQGEFRLNPQMPFIWSVSAALAGTGFPPEACYFLSLYQTHLASFCSLCLEKTNPALNKMQKTKKQNKATLSFWSFPLVCLPPLPPPPLITTQRGARLREERHCHAGPLLAPALRVSLIPLCYLPKARFIN